MSSSFQPRNLVKVYYDADRSPSILEKMSVGFLNHTCREIIIMGSVIPNIFPPGTFLPEPIKEPEAIDVEFTTLVPDLEISEGVVRRVINELLGVNFIWKPDYLLEM